MSPTHLNDILYLLNVFRFSTINVCNSEIKFLLKIVFLGISSINIFCPTLSEVMIALSIPLPSICSVCRSYRERNVSFINFNLSTELSQSVFSVATLFSFSIMLFSGMPNCRH